MAYLYHDMDAFDRRDEALAVLGGGDNTLTLYGPFYYLREADNLAIRQMDDAAIQFLFAQLERMAEPVEDDSHYEPDEWVDALARVAVLGASLNELPREVLENRRYLSYGDEEESQQSYPYDWWAFIQSFPNGRVPTF